MKRDTVGKISSTLSQKENEKIDVVAQQEGMTEDYLKNVVECVENNLEEFVGDFYIIVVTKKERLMKNVLRNYFFPRKSCPTPEHDQTVFKFNRRLDQLEYIWSVPCSEACEYLLNSASEVIMEEQELLKFVLQFLDGSLLRLSKKLNNEKPDSSLLIN